MKAFERSGDTLYVGGDFTYLGPRTGSFATVDSTTGSALAFRPDADGAVSALALDGTTLYVGGSFLNIAGQARSRVAALATAWDPNVHGGGGGGPRPPARRHR